MSDYALGWLQAVGVLPTIDEVRGWVSAIGIYGFGSWMVLQTVAHGKALAFLKGNSATKDGLSAAVDRVTAANLEHRVAVADELERYSKDLAELRALLAERRKKPR